MRSTIARTLHASFIGLTFFYLSTTSAWALVVDDFANTGTPSPNTGTSSPWPITLNNSSPFTHNGSETSTIGVVGGTRGHQVLNTSLNGSSTYSLGNSVLDYQSTSDGSASIHLTYGALALFGPKQDLALPYNAGTLTVSFQSLSIPAGETFTMNGKMFFDTAPPNANTFQGVGSLTQLTGPTSQLVFTYPLDLSASSSQIDVFELDITPPAGTAFQLDSITFTPVPEPSTLVLLTLGAVSMLVRKRR